jgi:hypothetical protein
MVVASWFVSDLTGRNGFHKQEYDPHIALVDDLQYATSRSSLLKSNDFLGAQGFAYNCDRLDTVLLLVEWSL